MSDLRPRGTKINIDGREYIMLPSLNAIDAFQDRFDCSIEKIDEMMKDPRKCIKVLKFMIATFINEGIDEFEMQMPYVDEQWVGRKLDASNLDDFKERFMAAFSEGAPEIDEDDINPNVMSE